MIVLIVTCKNRHYSHTEPHVTTKLTQLTTHWDAADAYAVIAFLDELRNVLLASYGDDIAAMLKASSHDHRQQQFEFSEDNNF